MTADPNPREVAAALKVERHIGDALHSLAFVTDDFAAMGLLGSMNGEMPQDVVAACSVLQSAADAVRAKYGGVGTQ